MKNLLALIAFSYMLIACNSSDSTNFTINGSIANGVFNDAKVELKALSNQFETTTTLASGKIEDAKFTLKGNVEAPQYVSIVIDGEPTIYLFLEKVNFSLYIDNDNFANCYTKGSPLNDAFTEFNNTMELNSKIIGQLYINMEKAEGEDDDKLKLAYIAKQEEIKSFFVQTVKSNPNIFGTMILSNAIITRVVDYEEANELYNSFSDDLKTSSPFLDKIEDNIERLKPKVEATIE